MQRAEQSAQRDPLGMQQCADAHVLAWLWHAGDHASVVDPGPVRDRRFEQVDGLGGQLQHCALVRSDRFQVLPGRIVAPERDAAQQRARKPVHRAGPAIKPVVHAREQRDRTCRRHDRCPCRTGRGQGTQQQQQLVPLGSQEDVRQRRAVMRRDDRDAVRVRAAMRSSVASGAILTPGVSSIRTSSPPVECPTKCNSAALSPPCAMTWRRRLSARRTIDPVGCVGQRTIRASIRRLLSARVHLPLIVVRIRATVQMARHDIQMV